MLVAGLVMAQFEQRLQRLNDRRFGIVREDRGPTGLLQLPGIDAFLDAIRRL